MLLVLDKCLLSRLSWLWSKWKGPRSSSEVFLSIYLSIYHLFTYLLFFRQRGREGEGEGKKHQRVVASHTPPTGNLARNPSMCSYWKSKLWPFGSQAGIQSTDSQQRGPVLKFFSPYVHRGPGPTSRSAKTTCVQIEPWWLSFRGGRRLFLETLSQISQIHSTDLCGPAVGPEGLCLGAYWG